MRPFLSKSLITLLLTMAATLNPSISLAQDRFSLCWSIYVGWMPWEYGDATGIIDKWADKYDIEIDVVQINDYIESINQYTAGDFDACSMTNMDALTIPAASGVDSTAVIVGDFSNGNDAIILKEGDTLADVEGQRVNLVELSVSHYLLARGLDSVGLSERDVTVVNTSDADMVAAYTTDDVTAVATWNPIVNEILGMPDATKVFDSSQIPGEIIDTLMVKTEVVENSPEFAMAVTGAWYEIMAAMESDPEVRAHMGEASGTDQEGYEAQLATTQMFYSPSEAVEFVNSAALKTTMENVANFSFDHGLLGEGAPDAGFIGIETPSGVYGNSRNIQLRFDPAFMKMAAEGEL